MTCGRPESVIQLTWDGANLLDCSSMEFILPSRPGLDPWAASCWSSCFVGGCPSSHHTEPCPLSAWLIPCKLVWSRCGHHLGGSWWLCFFGSMFTGDILALDTTPTALINWLVLPILMQPSSDCSQLQPWCEPLVSLWVLVQSSVPSAEVGCVPLVTRVWRTGSQPSWGDPLPC